MIRKRLSISPADVSRLYRESWDWCWTNRREGDFFLTATDVHRRLRAAAKEMLDGVSAGSYGPDIYGFGTLRLSGPFDLDDVRAWLRSECYAGRLEVSNPRGYTSTGARYRPVGTPLSAAEEKAKTVSPEEKARRQHIRHLAGPDGKAACSAGKVKKSLWGRSYGRHIAPRPTDDVSKVTCKKCLKLPAKVPTDLGQAPAAEVVRVDEGPAAPLPPELKEVGGTQIIVHGDPVQAVYGFDS